MSVFIEHDALGHYIRSAEEDKTKLMKTIKTLLNRVAALEKEVAELKKQKQDRRPE